MSTEAFAACLAIAIVGLVVAILLLEYRVTSLEDRLHELEADLGYRVPKR